MKNEIIWSAGFFDGEGCVTLKRYIRKNATYSLEVSIGQKYKEPLEVFVDLYGGKVLKQGNNAYQWHVYSNTAYEALKLLVPHLRIKKQQAEEAIRWFELTQTMSLEDKLVLSEQVYTKLQNLKRNICQ